MLAFGAVAADEWLDLRKWKDVRHSLVEPVPLTVRLRARSRAGNDEAGQGCVDWPTGRALLQWAVDGGVPLTGARVLEIGAGVGLASIGLALASHLASEEQSRASSTAAGGPPKATTVIATDVCAAALANLRRNAEANGAMHGEVWSTTEDTRQHRTVPGCDGSLSAPMPCGAAPGADASVRTGRSSKKHPSSANAASNGAAAMRVEFWDAAGGRKAVEQMPVDPRALTHVIGADLVSQPIAGVARPANSGTAGGSGGDKHGGSIRQGGGDKQEGTVGGDGSDGLEATLAALLDANPELKVTLVLYNRLAGGAVCALSSNVGVQGGGCALDPAIAAFERRCCEHGLCARREALPGGCVQRLAAAQPLHVRAQWFLGGVWDGLMLYHVTRAHDS
jgi:hypothetical protein